MKEEKRIDLRGTVKGQTIVLDEPIDLPEGERGGVGRFVAGDSSH